MKEDDRPEFYFKLPIWTLCDVDPEDDDPAANRTTIFDGDKSLQFGVLFSDLDLLERFVERQSDTDGMVSASIHTPRDLLSVLQNMKENGASHVFIDIVTRDQDSRGANFEVDVFARHIWACLRDAASHPNSEEPWGRSRD